MKKVKFLFKQQETYLALIVVLLALVVQSVNPAFLTYENLSAILKSYAMLGIMSVGVLFVLILGGQPDVSFTAIAQVVEYVVVLACIRWGGNLFTAFLAAAVLGIAMGLVNGLAIHYFRVPTIVVTIATSNIYFGLLYVFSKGRLINEVPRMFIDFGHTLLFPATSAAGGVYGFSLMTVIWLATLLLAAVILRWTSLGRNIYAMGGNEVAAERVGINTLKTRLFVFGFVGFLSGIAAIVHVSIVTAVVPNIIVGKEMEVIAAVVVGGASLFGGRGTVIGTLLGVLLFAMLNNALTLLRLPSYWYNVAIGIVITAAVTINAIQQNRQERARVRVLGA